MPDTDLGLRKKLRIKTWKRLMTKKKGRQKFWEIDSNFLGGNAETFSETPLKSRKKNFGENLSPRL